MIPLSTEMICDLSGASLRNLRRWQRHGLVTVSPSTSYWTDAQFDDVLKVMHDSAGGATASEISLSRSKTEPVKTAGWSARRGELLALLESGSDRQLIRAIRSLSLDFVGDDFINSLMKPLCRWLRDDERGGANRRFSRFRDVTKHHHHCVARAALRAEGVPLLLEIAVGADDTDMFLEAIRLTGQGFCVDVVKYPSASLSEGILHYYDHHLQLKHTPGCVQDAA